MKLNELVKLLPPKTDVTLEIIEETTPNGIYAEEILERYPHAVDYEIVNIEPGIACLEDNDEPTLMVEVTNAKGESECLG